MRLLRKSGEYEPVNKRLLEEPKPHLLEGE